MSSLPQNAVVPSALAGLPFTIIRPERIHWSALRLDVSPAEDNMRLRRQGSSGLKGFAGDERDSDGISRSGLGIRWRGVCFDRFFLNGGCFRGFVFVGLGCLDFTDSELLYFF